MQSVADRKKLWRPPPRPEWMQRMNEEGQCMNIRGVVPLDADSLIKSAIETTGLSDFGADDWREPFKVLTKALEDEAQLNLMGRIRTRSELLQLLEARLHIEDTYKRHPEIEDEEVKQPFVVVGQGRSGTSFLLNVLAASPENGAITAWEAIFPCPPPEKATYHSDPRIALGHKRIDMWNRYTPTMATMHEFAGEVPMECAQVLGLTFNSTQWFACFGEVPSYNEFAMKLDIVETLRYHKRVLKLLQWKNPRKHWALKSISHMDVMPQLLQVYPDACFIWPHRDPVRALASAMNFMGTAQWACSDFPLKSNTIDEVLDPRFSAWRMDNAIVQLESGAVPKSQLCNILYRDLVGDTMGTIERIYAHFGIPFTSESRAGIAKYLKENPREIRPPHAVDKGTAERIREEREIFRHYIEYFSVPDE